MPEIDIVHYEIGLHVAIRSGNQSWRGIILLVKNGFVDVQTRERGTERFSRVTRRLHGWKGTNYDRPFLQSIAVADARDRAYAEATRRAGERLRASGTVA